MKLQSQINMAPIEFECDGATWFMRKLTVPQVQKLQKEFSKLTEDTEDMSPLMVLFTDVLVGDDGKPFEEIEAGLTFDELVEMVPIVTLQNLADKITTILSGQSEGN